MKVLRRLSVSICALAIGLSGCGNIDGIDDIESHEEALGKGLSFENCNWQQRETIEKGYYALHNALYQEYQSLVSCVKDAVFSPAIGHSPEYVLNRLSDYQLTHFECTQNPGNYAVNVSFNTGQEKIRIDADYLNKKPAAKSLAGLIAWGLLYNKGFAPSYGTLETDYSVNNQVKACVEKGTPNTGMWRHTVKSEVELAPAGETGGTPFRLGCTLGSKSFMLGLRTRAEKTESWINSAPTVVAGLTMVCENKGAYYPQHKSVGGAAGTSKSAYCGQGELVTGIYGREGIYIDQVGVRCTKRSDIVAKKNTGYKRFAGGGSGGGYFERYCAPGMAVNRIEGRNSDGQWLWSTGRRGAKINELRVVCRGIDEQNRGTTVQTLALVGTASGFVQDRICSGFGALTGFFGRSYLEIDRLGGICDPLNATSKGMQINKLHRHVIPAAGGDGGTAFATNCQANQAMVGVTAETRHNRLSNLRPICVDTKAYSTSAYPQWLSKWDGFWATNSHTYQVERMCSPGYHVVGLKTWSKKQSWGGTTVQGLQLLCRKLKSYYYGPSVK